MIELTELQRQNLAQESPPRVINPLTNERFVLISEDVYEQVRKILAPLNRNWDNPADADLIKKS